MPTEFDSQNTELVDLRIALADADVVVLLVDHASFKAIDLGLLSGKQVVDTRGIWALFA
jgi:UDP-N-acetyl-D-mannosaminuronic acid dehydrogenase